MGRVKTYRKTGVSTWTLTADTLAQCLVFASAAARDAQLADPTVGQQCVTTDTGTRWYYNGTAWYPLAAHIYRAYDEASGTSAPIAGAGGFASVFSGSVNMVNGCLYQFVCTTTFNGSGGVAPWYGQLELYVDGIHRRWSLQRIDTSGVGVQLQIVHNFAPNATRSWPFEMRLANPWFAAAGSTIVLSCNYNQPKALDIFCLGKQGP